MIEPRNIFISVLCFVAIFRISADMSFETMLDSYKRYVALSEYEEPDSLNYHSYSTDNFDSAIRIGPWKGKFDRTTGNVQIIYPELFVSWNSTRNWGGNDGNLWQGRGVNYIARGGVEYTGTHYSFRFYPEIWGSENLDYDIVTTSFSSGYGDYWTVFDNLQRYGDLPYSDFSWGQSDIRFFLGDFTLGLSNENIRLGPGQMNNIILSDNAGGFPHFDFGTRGKINLGEFGSGEFRVIWGLLKESEFFDNDYSNDYGWISGSYMAVSPSLIPGFTLGFNYQYYKPLSGWDEWDLVRAVPFLDRSNSPTDLKDMMISIPFSWSFPEVGFEVYGEWARNDNFGGIRDLFKYPEHTQGYTFGINQVLRKEKDNLVILSVEFTNLKQERTYEIRAAGPWYRHAWAGWAQGYTNNGQVLGAEIGPGSDSQWAKLTWITHKGSTGFFMQRIALDKDYFYTAVKSEDVEPFIEFNTGVEKLVFINNFDIYGRAIFVSFLNNNFKDMDDLFNIHFEFGIKYKF